MNVPFPALFRVSAAGVGKQSVWGLRIIAELNYYSAIVLQHRQELKVLKLLFIFYPPVCIEL